MLDKPNVETIKATATSFDVPFQRAIDKKKKYIASCMGKIRQDINERKKILRETNKHVEQELLDRQINKLEKEFKSYQIYLKYLGNPQADTKVITDNEIEIARNYPIQEFLPNNYRGKGNINCLLPGHDDKNASMQTTNNFLWCHTCQKKMDAIDLTMMFKGLDFKSAVKLLARS